MKRYYLYFCVLLFSACASLPVSTSYWESPKKSDEDVRITYFDSEHKLRCTVTNDSTSLFVAFDTNDKSVKRGILKNGILVFIDREGKKSITNYVKYPLEPIFNTFHKESSESSNFYKDHKNLNKRISESSNTLGWNNGSGEQVINYLLEKKKGFNAQLYEDSSGYINYRLIIPLNQINLSSSGQPFTIGIKVPGDDKSIKKEGSEDISQAGGYGGGRGGMHGGGMGSVGNAPMHRAYVAEPLDIWFKTSLATKN